MQEASIDCGVRSADSFSKIMLGHLTYSIDQFEFLKEVHPFCVLTYNGTFIADPLTDYSLPTSTMRLKHNSKAVNARKLRQTRHGKITQTYSMRDRTSIRICFEP